MNAPSNTQQWDNRKADRGLSNWDIRNNFTFNLTYELPFGKDLNGARRQLVSGWTLNGIATFAGGAPFTVFNGVDRSRDATRNSRERPSLLPGRSNNPVLGGPDKYYDPTAFVLPELGTYGDVARNSIRGPGFSNLDFALNKNFPIREELSIQFRAEFFNITNHPNFGQPDQLLFTSGPSRRPTAGDITRTVNTSRQIQFAVKVIF